MGNRTPLYELHIAAGAKMVDFGGWDMPIHYGSQIEEHHAVRLASGMCDVSHMTIVDVGGEQCREFLRYLLANDVERLAVGDALYSVMLNQSGGILDDLIVYRQQERYRLVVNCATREKDLAWMRAQGEAFDVRIDLRDDLAIIAVQGPESIEQCIRVTGVASLVDLKPFTATWFNDWYVARTGYTGEQGLEIMLPNQDAAELWSALQQAGVEPIGLGARDTLRLEAGMNLYGSDMDESVTPAEAALSWTVAPSGDRDFIGREALDAGRPGRKLVGLVLTERGVLRAHYKVRAAGQEIGEITSGAFSPTLQHSIALARIDSRAAGPLTVDIRGKQLPVKQVRPPFVRNGNRVFKIIE